MIKFEHRALRYGLYISGSLLTALLALGAVAGIAALLVLLPPLLPMAIGGGITLGTLVATLAMAPLGAIFFNLTFAFFHCINQIPTFRKANHYLASGINNAVNNGQAVESTTSSLLNLTVSLLPGAFWLKPVLTGIKYGSGLVAAMIGFGLGVKERKEKYRENSRCEQNRWQEERRKLEQQAKVVQAEAKLLQQAQHPYKQVLINAQLQKWRQGNLAAGSNSKDVAITQTRPWLDTLSNKFNTVKNYLRNVKLGYKITFGLVTLPVLVLIMLKLLGIIAISPLLIPTIMGAAAMAAPFIGMVFATMNYYRDKVEDQVFDDNKSLTKELFADKLALHILYEEEHLHKQLTQITASEILTTKTPVKQTNFRRKYKNPLQKLPYGKRAMYGIGTFAGWLSLGFAVFAMMCTLLAFKFTLLTAGIGLPVLVLSLSLSVLFSGLAAGNLLRRGYKEYKQQSACEQETLKYQRLHHELQHYRDVEPAIRLKLNTKSQRSQVAVENYACYKGIAAAKKVGKVDFSLQDALHAWHIPTTSMSSGISLMNVSVHPLMLIPVILALPLMYVSYRCEKIRIKRDTALDKLKLVNAHMEIELAQRKAAKTRIELVAEAKTKLAAPMQALNAHKKASEDKQALPQKSATTDFGLAHKPHLDNKALYAKQRFWQDKESASLKKSSELSSKLGFFKPEKLARDALVGQDSRLLVAPVV